MKKAITIFCINLLICLNLFGQDTAKCNAKYFKDNLLDKLVGQWNLSGEVGKRKIENNFSAQWTLNHQFLELNFVDTTSPPRYVGKVFIGYDCVSERYVAHWLDNFGGRFSETLGYGTKAEQTIEFRFEYPDAPFLNKFIYNAKDDSWQFHLTTKNDKGEWIVFADEYLKRKKITTHHENDH